MALEPFFSLAPSSPLINTYNPEDPGAAWAFGLLHSFGGVTLAASPYRLPDQCRNDEIILGVMPADIADQDLVSADWWRQSMLYMLLDVWNVSSERDLLLLFELRAITGLPSAQFFVGADPVLTVELGGVQHVALVLESPNGNGHMYLFVRLASSNPSYVSAMGFKGMDCYLL